MTRVRNRSFLQTARPRLVRTAFTLTISCAILYGCTVRKAGTPTDREILLPARLQNPKLEFSSMVWRGKSLWLIPQHPQTFGGWIYALRQSDLEMALSGTPVNHYDTLPISGMDAVRDRIGPAIYEGIEATVIVDDRIFFTLETKPSSTNCYLVGGRIFGNRIVVDPSKMLALPKPRVLSNAGFESLAWDPQRGKLLAFFEYNKEDGSPAALVIDTALNAAAAPILLPVLPFRLTDLVPVRGAKGTSAFLGINFSYKGAKEYGEYIGKDSLRIRQFDPSLAAVDLRKTCYSRIVRLNVAADGSADWRKIRDISFACDNWEGIVPFRSGVLLVNDEYTDSGTGTRLRWFRLPDN